ncbi:hypothetical protein KCU83_g4902, partial [Aureobasidium melanogenum]
MADEIDNKRDMSVDELCDQLDALWEKHLILLDSYHQAQQQIARHFSSGFFHLAQATFKSTTRVRYGQEYYDDRMQATTRFDASVDDQDLPHLALKVNDTTSPSTKDSTNESSDGKADEKEEDTPTQQPTPPSTPPTESEELPEEQSHENKSEAADDKESKQKKVRDPIHWYGILVPPTLRSSQNSFKSAIQDPIVEAANSAQALRYVNMEIRKLRKDIKKAEKRVS